MQQAARYEYVDHASGALVALQTDPEFGQPLHPTRGFMVCGAMTRTFGSGTDSAATLPFCMDRAGAGTDHLGIGACRRHGGRNAAQTNAGKRALAESRSRATLEKLGVPVTVDPVDALLGLVHEAAGNVEFLRGRVQDLGLEVVGDVFSLSREGDPVATSEDARALVKLYNDERDRLAKVSKLAIDAGIAERKVRLLEEQAQVVLRVLRAVLGRAGLEDAQKARVLTELSEEFRRVDAVGPTKYLTDGVSVREVRDGSTDGTELVDASPANGRT